MPARSATTSVVCYVMFLLVVAPQADASFRCDCSINGVRNRLVGISCERDSSVEDVDKAVVCQKARYRAVDYGYVVNPDYSSLYRLYRTSRNWASASESCRRDGGHLAVAETQEEKNFLVEQLKAQGGGRTTNALLGVRKDAVSDEQYYSVTGVAGTDVNMVLGWNWPAGTPREVPGQLCVELFHVADDFGDEFRDQYAFHTRDCDRPAAYFCERPLNPPAQPNYTFVDGLGFYKPSKQWLTYIEADLECQNAAGRLVVPDKQQEADALMKGFDMFKKVEKIYVGIDDRRRTGVFETSDGVRLEDLGFLNWAPGALENRGIHDRCVTFTSRGSYELVNCETLLPSICEYAFL